MPTMKAAVMHEPGGPEVLKLEQIPVPEPKSGEVLLRVRAFGINRSELFTRQGQSPDVKLPRVLGIEAVGVVESAPGGEFHPGTFVATVDLAAASPPRAGETSGNDGGNNTGGRSGATSAGLDGDTLVLCRQNAGFDVLQLAFDGATGRRLAVAGLRTVQVL